MAQIPRTVTCPYPGFETFVVTYNMMATVKQVELAALAWAPGLRLTDQTSSWTCTAGLRRSTQAGRLVKTHRWRCLSGRCARLREGGC